ncbi:fimbria/pilus outer membrane usher protein [Serratia fonticola]
MRHPFHYSLLATMVMLAVMPAAHATEDTPAILRNDAPTGTGVRFDPIFLSSSEAEAVDLSRFEHGAAASPGTYPADIFVNGELATHEKVLFVEQADKQVLPCLSPAILKKINFNYSQLPTSFTEALRNEQSCYPLTHLIPQAQVAFDSGLQRLDISIPQAMMQNIARGYVSPELWDKGIPALLLGYNTNVYTTHSRGETSNSVYTGINAGINIGAWYFRHDGNYNWQQRIGGQYQSINNYVERDIPAILGRVRLGETSTKGQVFDTLPFRGVELVNDDRMLAPSLRGYAPNIRGIARTNARVTVRQNSLVIYETTVSPGAFVIDDLYPTGFGGNLDVTVKEADGSVQNFQVPYASVAQLLRPGTHHYDVVAGKLNDISLSTNPTLVQATYQRGLTNTLTGYGGLQASNDYYALQLGAALSTSIGAFSADVSQARVHLNSTKERMNSGQSFQLSYSKFLPATNSNLTIAAYRYSTSGYYDYMTAMRAIDAEQRGQSADNIWRPRNRFNITMNQGLPAGWGQMYVTGYTQDYWNQGNTDLQYQLGYSNEYRDISYSLSAGRVRGMRGGMETNWLLNLSMPLGRKENANLPSLSASLNHSTTGQSGQQVGISGSAGEDYQYNFGASAMHYNQGGGSSMALNGGYRSAYTHMTATYGAGRHYQNASAGLSGTMIAWPQGVVMTPYTGDTFAVVEAKGATGAKVGGYSGVRIDPWGHAAVPYLNPYEMNEITIDPKGMPYEVELENTSDKVAPHAGAVSKVTFKTQQGTPLLIMAQRANGEAVPFGAEVFDSVKNNIGSVGQMGQIYARVEKQRDQLTVKWGSQPGQYCQLNYILPPKQPGSTIKNIIRFDSICRED